MEQGILYFCSVVLVLAFVSASACVAPPAPSGAQSAGSPGSASPGAGAPVTTVGTTPMYVTIETPYGATPQRTAVPTPITAPPEEWVKIYRQTRSFGYNKTAISFTVKNPPMVVNFSVKPVNVTGTKIIFRGKVTQTEETVTYDYYSPYSWFEITVRNKNGGQILQQAGFGNSYGKQYPQALNQTMKVLSQGDLLIEMDGNQVTATIDMSVKKEGNIGNSTSPS